MSGTDGFAESGFNAGLVHLAYVRDDQKLLCWIPQDGQSPGASYARLPEVVGMEDPAAPLREETPKSGAVPVEGPGRVLYEETVDLIHSNGDALVPVWSGDFRKKRTKESWKGFGGGSSP
jgi:hypothetical protein